MSYAEYLVTGHWRTWLLTSVVEGLVLVCRSLESSAPSGPRTVGGAMVRYFSIMELIRDQESFCPGLAERISDVVE